MGCVQYHHIGHQPRFGAIALWALDTRGDLHEDRRAYDAKPDAGWLDWSHDNLFKEVKPIAKGRVELSVRAGSIHIPDVRVLRSRRRLERIMRRLDEAYPATRWYIFADGLNGVAASTLLADQTLEE